MANTLVTWHAPAAVRFQSSIMKMLSLVKFSSFVSLFESPEPLSSVRAIWQSQLAEEIIGGCSACFPESHSQKRALVLMRILSCMFYT